MRQIGIVKRVQIQRGPLKAEGFYNPAPLLVVDSLALSPEGVIGLLADGAEWIDAHHAQHPQTRYRGMNPISVSFSGHYAYMRERFGGHMVEGIAGENILVEAVSPRFMIEDLGKRLAFQNEAGGELVYLDDLLAAPPCAPFSQFALQDAAPPAPRLKETLQCLDHGIRGFYGAVQQPGTIRAGDVVYAVD